jgi:hypothetical protein
MLRLQLITLLCYLASLAHCPYLKKFRIIGEKPDLRLTGTLLNESLNRLQDARLINPVECLDNNHEKTTRFQPSLPLNKLTLGGFSQRLDESGNNEGCDLLLGRDPLVQRFDDQLIKHVSSDSLGLDFETLLREAYPDNKA